LVRGFNSQDFDLWLRIAKKYKVDYINEPLVNYYVHDNERLTTNPVYKIQGKLAINRKYQDYLESHPYLKSERLMSLIPYYLKISEKPKAKKAYLKAIRLAPLNLKVNLKYLLYFFVNISKVKTYIKKINILRLNKPES